MLGPISTASVVKLLLLTSIVACFTFFFAPWFFFTNSGSSEPAETSEDIPALSPGEVTCGSVMKLYNPKHNVRLHSHEVKYGTGSGQQSVTGVDSNDDHNSYWQIRAKNGYNCQRGVPIKCNQQIRIMHLNTRRNLHSHHFNSPLSGELEVSAFGEDGSGDEGDNWVVVCSNAYWGRGDQVSFRHVVTGGYLSVSGQTYGRPIMGQFEIAAISEPIKDISYWKAMEGIYVKPANRNVSMSSSSAEERDEL